MKEVEIRSEQRLGTRGDKGEIDSGVVSSAGKVYLQLMNHDHQLLTATSGVNSSIVHIVCTY